VFEALIKYDGGNFGSAAMFDGASGGRIKPAHRFTEAHKGEYGETTTNTCRKCGVTARDALIMALMEGVAGRLGAKGNCFVAGTQVAVEDEPDIILPTEEALLRRSDPGGIMPAGSVNEPGQAKDNEGSLDWHAAKDSDRWLLAMGVLAIGIGIWQWHRQQARGSSPSDGKDEVAVARDGRPQEVPA
jgi:hypothetical protein